MTGARARTLPRVPNEEPARPLVGQAPGFVTGYWVDIRPNTGTSVIVFESEEAANAVAEGAPRLETDAFTVESFAIGSVVAHA